MQQTVVNAAPDNIATTSALFVAAITLAAEPCSIESSPCQRRAMAQFPLRMIRTVTEFPGSAG